MVIKAISEMSRSNALEMPPQRNHFPLGREKVQEASQGGEQNAEHGAGRAAPGRREGASARRVS